MPGFLIPLGAAGIGAGLMYFMDPDRGRRRRMLVRDQVSHSDRTARRELARAARDLANRVEGAGATARASIWAEQPDDDILVQRVRSRLGRATSHTRVLRVMAQNGRVRLEGPALADEAPDIVYAARHTPGVRDVEDALEIHQTADVSELQSSTDHPGEEARLGWKPANRLVSGVAAVGLLGYGMRRGGPLGLLAKIGGAGVLTRAAVNRPLASVVGLDGNCHVDVQKTMTVHVPVEEVFQFWSDFTNFPRFMAHLESVRLLDDERSRWVIKAPGGVPAAWTARVTSRVDNELLAWQSEPGSAIEHHGQVRFEPTDDGRTRVTVRLSYQPPVGLIGHTVAAILGFDPKHQIDDDLMRLKSLLEDGRTSANGHAVTRHEVQAAGS